MFEKLCKILDLNAVPKGVIISFECVVIAGVTYFVYKKFQQRKINQKRNSYPKNVVVLHQFPLKENFPSLSPYALKLETWIKMAGIPYQNEFTIWDRSAKGKVPWITYNGKDVADSHFCIKFMIKEFGKDLSENLNQSDRAIAHAFFKLNEESLKWPLAVQRYIYGSAKEIGIPSWIYWILSKKIKKAVTIQGYGLHSKDEIFEIGFEDLKAINDFIGTKKFLMGDSVCNEDATIFAMLTQLVFYDKGPLNKFIMTECANIRRYLINVIEAYWPRWDYKDKIHA